MLELITYFLKAAFFSEISKGVRRCNAISLLILSKALINASKYLEVTF